MRASTWTGNDLSSPATMFLMSETEVLFKKKGLSGIRFGSCGICWPSRSSTCSSCFIKWHLPWQPLFGMSFFTQRVLAIVSLFNSKPATTKALHKIWRTSPERINMQRSDFIDRNARCIGAGKYTFNGLPRYRSAGEHFNDPKT